MQTATATATHPSSIKSIAFIEKNVLDTLIFPSFCSSCFCSDLFTLWVILTMWTLTDSVMLWFLYTIKKRIFRTAIWDSNRPQPLPSITLKYFIHVSYELLQLAAIMTFVQLQQAAALCLCSPNPRRCQLCGRGDGSLFVLLLPSVMCGHGALPSHHTYNHLTLLTRAN